MKAGPLDSPDVSPTASRAILWLVLGLTVASFIAHFVGIRRSLPYLPEVDEPLFVQSAVHIAATGDLNPRWFGNPGSTIIYPLAAMYCVWYALANGGAWIGPEPLVQAGFDTDFGGFYYLGRLLSITYATLTIPAIFLLGRRVFNPRVGIAGALLYACYSLPLSYAQMVRTDAVATFFTVLGLWLCVRLYEQPSRRGQLLAGAAIGLGIASRYFLVALLPVLLVVDLALWRALLRRRAPAGGQGAWLLSAAIGLLAAGAAFALSTPFLFLDLSTALANLAGEARTAHLGADGLSPLGNLSWYVGRVIPLAITYPQVVPLLGGIVLAARRGPFAPRLVLGFGVLFIVGVSLLALHWARWVIEVLPLAALLAAYALDALAAWLSARLALGPQVRPALLALGAVLFSVWPAHDLIVFDRKQLEPSTRVVARVWMVEHLPSGSRVAQDQYGAALAGTTFSVEEFPTLAAGHRLEDLAGLYDYVVASSITYGRYFAEPARYAQEVKFYEALFAGGQLLQEIGPSGTRDGPVIRIYALRP